MVNSVVLVGRLTKDVEIRKTESNKSVASITLALNDRFNKDHTDFINCVVWNQSADYLSKYAGKGDQIALTGRISTRSYEGKNGKVFVTEVVADQVAILGSRKDKEEIGGVPKEVLHKGSIAPTTEDDVWVDEYEEPKTSNVNLDISPDDLPFY